MKTSKKYRGVVIPMITPFTADGGLDEGAAEKLLGHVVDAGAIPFILGTTGESASIPLEMRLRWVRRTMATVPAGATVYAGISDNCLDTSLDLARRFFDLGVRAFVAHLPSYYPLTDDMMRRHYEVLAERSPAPVMIYNIKSTTHMSIPVSIVQELSRHPNLVGLKDSERDLDRYQRLIELFRDRADFSLFSGWTVQSATTLLMGFDGIVPSTGNIIPGRFQSLYEAAVRGDGDKALQLQAGIDPLANFHQANMLGSEAIVALKALLHAMGLCGADVLPPLTRLSPAVEAGFIDRARPFELF